MLRQEKIGVVADIKKLFNDSSAYFVTDYQGLNVADITDLRRNLREKNVKFLVAKNTLFQLAAKDAGVEGLDQFFTGPTAVAFAVDDPSVAAKILHQSYKAKELPRFKAFVVEDQIHGPEDVKRFAELPSREVLLSQLVAAVEAPFTQLVSSLDGLFRELVGTVDALAEKTKSES
jgi:large subunit ribosomal protein L10